MNYPMVKIHDTQPSAHLPAHEKAARRNRHGILLLPAVPSLTLPPTPRPKPHTGHKTFAVSNGQFIRPRP